MKSFSRSHNWQITEMSILTHLPAKLLQLCPTLCDPMDCSLPGSSVHGILQARILGVGCHALLQAIFPTQGLNLCLPALTGGFFTTGTTWDLIPNTMSFVFLIFIFFKFYLQWILSYIEMKQPWVYMCSPSRSPLPPPSPPTPSRFSQCTRSEHLSHASNLGW